MESKTEDFFNNFVLKTKNISGIDCIYLIDGSYKIIKEENLTKGEKYFDPVVNIIKESNHSNFHTFTLLNESGLIVVTRLISEPFYLVVIAGEHAPVDLISLFKLCQESRVF